MSLVKYEPVGLLSRMQNEINEFFRRDQNFPALFDDAFKLIDTEWSPRIDIDEDASNFVVTADVPGVAPKDIQVSMQGGVLSISGERKAEAEKKKKNYHRKECMTGSFERKFLLPDTADDTKVTAEGKHGVLTIKVAKKPAVKPRTIAVKSDQ